MEKNPVWVIAEQIDCHIQSVSLQLIGQACQLADQLETSVEAILLGNNIKQQARQLISAGADKVYIGDDPELEVYQQSRDHHRWVCRRPCTCRTRKSATA